MKKNELTNRRLVSALTVGISAMMALATPITAYANGEAVAPMPDEGQGGATENIGSVQESAPAEAVTQEAQQAADNAESACVSENVQPQPEENAPSANNQSAGTEESAPSSNNQSGAAENTENGSQNESHSAKKESAEAANIILNGDEAQGIESAAQKIKTEETQALSDAADAIINDKTNEDGEVTEKSAVTGYEEAAQSVANAKQDLEQAETANEQAEAQYKEANAAIQEAADKLEGTAGIQQFAENISETVTKTEEQAKAYVNIIANATTEEAAAQAQRDLTKLLTDNEATIETQKLAYDSLSKAYDDAIGRLEKAQEELANQETNFDSELSQASKKAQVAKAEVVAAQQKVDKLADALEAVKNAIPDEADSAADDLDVTRGNNWEGLFGGNGSRDYEKSREVMKKAVIDYYMSQVLGIDIITSDTDDTDDVDYSPVFTTHESNKGYEHKYHELTYYYKDTDGTIKQGTKYFNWDSIAKTDTGHENLKANQSMGEATAGIVIYEKTEAEVHPEKIMEDIAKELLSAHEDDVNYQRNGAFVMSDEKGNSTKCPQQGMYTLYSYTDEDGSLKYITQFELYGKYPGKPGVTYKNEGNLCNKFDYREENGVRIYMSPTGKEYAGLKMLTADDFVTQNQNGLYRNANCLILGDNQTISDVLKGENGYSFVHNNVISAYGISSETVDRLIADNKKLNDYITLNSTANLTTIKAQYDAYSKEVTEAKAAADNAVEQVNKLDKAISDLSNRSSGFRKMITAKELLGLDDISVATYLGLDVSVEDAAELDNLDINGLKKKLVELKKQADDKVNAANILFEQVKEQKEKAQEEYEKAVERIKAAGADTTGNATTGGDTTGGDTTGGNDGTSQNIVTIGEQSQAVNPAPAPVADAYVNVNADANANDNGGAAMAVDQRRAARQAYEAAQAEAADNTGEPATIEDEGAALAQTIGESNETIDVESDEVMVSIQDEETAKALLEEEPVKPEKMGFWWLLLIAIFGEAGREMYEKHKEEKEEKARIDD